MRLVFAGTPHAAVPALRRLLDSPHEVVAVLTRPDAPAGRGRHLVPSPVKAVALEADIPVLTPRRMRDEHLHDELAALEPDCCPVVAYGNLVPPSLLAVPPRGWINLHFSLLPAWRGAAPVQRSIIAGDEETGVSVFRLEEGLDTGPVFTTMRTRIEPDETSGDLMARLSVAGAELLTDTLDGIEAGTIEPVPQPESGFSVAAKVEVADARVDWSRPAAQVDRLIRGCSPAPGAWTTFRGERVKLDPVSLDVGTPADGEVSAAVLDVTNKRVLVGTGSGPVRLGLVRAAGKKPMPAADWARGVRPEPGERFE
ncbi:MAG: methionyl-tRNA formyltransferase [Actinomycetales bacterium]